MFVVGTERVGTRQTFYVEPTVYVMEIMLALDTDCMTNLEDDNGCIVIRHGRQKV
jgi:hypothetical protein